MLDNLYGYTEENEEKGYYNFRSHQDNNKQYCPYCGDEREFIFDRCVTCSNQ